MKVIIVGMGRLGTELAFKMEKGGKKVVAVDSDPAAFDHLKDNFIGKIVEGIGFDKDVLEQAGIQRADALVACTTSDEANVVIARIAREIYKVPHVIARSYDSRKADIYRKLGIQTISTTAMGVEKVNQMLAMGEFDSVFDMGSGSVNLLRFDAPLWLVGHSVNEITRVHDFSVVSIVRDSTAFLPTSGSLIQEDDVLYFAVDNSAQQLLKETLGLD